MNNNTPHAIPPVMRSIPDFSFNFSESVLARRFETLTQKQNESTSSLAVIVFLSISFLIYISSYFIIFEDDYYPPDQFTDDIIFLQKIIVFL